MSDISYPFWGGSRSQNCGGGKDFELHCDHNQHASIQIGSDRHIFPVLHINNTNYTIRMSRTGLNVDDVCSPTLSGIDDDLSHSHFRYFKPEALNNITIFYDCPKGAWLGANTHTCPYEEYPIAFYQDVNKTLYNKFPDISHCKESFNVSVSGSVHLADDGGIDDLGEALREGFGFDMNYDVPFAQKCIACVNSGGACGTNGADNYQFTCHCPDGSDASDCYGNILNHCAFLPVLSSPLLFP